MTAALHFYFGLTGWLERAGTWLAPFALRLLLAFEFGEAGLEKYRGDNWFASIEDQFPFPFSALPADLSWFLATWGELLGAAALVVGFGTRFFSAALIMLTVVAWMAVHAGNGYNVCDNGFKLPLIYLVLFVPLLLNGAGKLGLDHWLAARVRAGGRIISAGSARSGSRPGLRRRR